MKISFWMGVMLMLASCGGRQEDADVEQEYELMTVATSDYKLSTEYVASLKERQDIRIIPRVEGYLQGICVTEGEHVKEGQVLFMLDDASYRAALQSAQANVQQMTALLAKTQLDYAGKQKLYEKKFISDHELASAKSDLDVAKANLAAAKASLASAGNDLSYTVLRSLSDGVIGRIPYRKGDYVGPNIQDGLTVVADNACMRAYFSMSENALMNYLAEYKTKEAALLQMPDLKLRLSNGRLYDKTGRAESISGIVDESTGAVQVCAVFDNSDGILLSGGTARVRIAYQTAFNVMLARYTSVAMSFIRHRWLAVGSIATATVAMVVLMKAVPTGFVPDEDAGAINIDVNAPSGYTMSKTQTIMTRLSKQVRDLPAVRDVGAVTGFSFSGSGSNHGMIFVQLKAWDKRPDWHVNKVVDQINDILADEHEARCFASMPGMIEGYGNSGGFEFSVLDMGGRDVKTFYDVTQSFLDNLNERSEVEEAYSGYDINYPQYAVDVDASRCKKMGVSPASVLNELSAYMGSAYVSNFNLYNKVYQVTMQLRPEDRRRKENLDDIFVRSDKGEMLPVSQFVRLTKEYRPQTLSRFNMSGSISVSGNTKSGYSSGDAICAVREVAASHLPKGYRVEFSGITREESRTSGNMFFILDISLFFMYLVMVALYESPFIPLAVLLSVPFGVAGSLLFALVFGVENNIYLQVGFIMLIGLLCKTAILLTEYATQCRQAGMSLKQSAFFSAKMRLRPILMTSLTMIFGMLPLMFASGAGANGSRTIGVGIVGGMLFGTLALLLVTPALFVMFQTLQERYKSITFTLSTDPLIHREMEIIEEKRKQKEQ